jgi:hypothetical protein
VALQHAVEQLHVLAEVAGAEEEVAHPRLRRLAHPLGAVWIREQGARALAECTEVAGLDQEPGRLVAKLYCTTTSARRCSALTITAFSSASTIWRGRLPARLPAAPP